MSREGLLGLRLGWAAVLGASLMLLHLSMRIAGLEPSGEALPRPVLAFHAHAAAMAAVGSLIIPRLFLAYKARGAKHAIVEGDAGGRRFADPRGARSVLEVQVREHLVLAMILTLAVPFEGFFFTYHRALTLSQRLAFFAVGWLLMLAHYPRPARYERLLEKVYDAKLE